MKKEIIALIVAGLVLFAIGFTVVVTQGSSYTLLIDIGDRSDDINEYTVSIDQERNIVEISDKYIQQGKLALKIRSISEGRAFIAVAGPDEYEHLEIVYVHFLGVITVNEYFGKSSAASIIPFIISAYMLLILVYLIFHYRKGIRQTLYRYGNIRNLGWILFLSLMLVCRLPSLVSQGGIADSVEKTLQSASNIAFVAFPVAFIVSVIVAFSNIRLMKKEGRNWKNMLGLILGILVCLGTVTPFILAEFLQSTTIVDVHDMNGIGHFVEMTVPNTILVIVSYLECILCATAVLSVKAAKGIPAFDKDFILILGCQIKNDGTLTPLLKGRADRAIEFAKMQKENAGKNIVFIPCGGKGKDEVLPEAYAIKNYLISSGISDADIITEDKSVNTFENFQNAIKLIHEKSTIQNPKIAFSTTNYHVFRSGILAVEQGIAAEGIGSNTRSYFWINAFIREFGATLYAEWKKHLFAIAILVLLTVFMVFVVWLSNAL